jgi:hypothetical protein
LARTQQIGRPEQVQSTTFDYLLTHQNLMWDPMKKTPTITPTQRGAAGAQLVAGSLGLAGVPTVLMPEGWPGYDLTAKPNGRPSQHIQVKTLPGDSWLEYHSTDEFHWLAAVLTAHSYTNPTGQHRIFIIPRAVADVRQRLHKDGMLRSDAARNAARLYGEWENNFALEERPTTEESRSEVIVRLAAAER